MSTREPIQSFCMKCGYDLVGLADAARCPECSLPVSASRYLAGPLVAESFRSIARGASVLIWATVLLFSLPLWIALVVRHNPVGLIEVVALLLAVLNAWGALVLTSERVARTAPIPSLLRMLLRLLAFAPPVLLAAAVFSVSPIVWALFAGSVLLVIAAISIFAFQLGDQLGIAPVRRWGVATVVMLAVFGPILFALTGVVCLIPYVMVFAPLVALCGIVLCYAPFHLAMLVSLRRQAARWARRAVEIDVPDAPTQAIP